MRWESRRRSTNVEDRRGQSSSRMGAPGGHRIRVPTGRDAKRAGGPFLLVIAGIAIALWIFGGISPLQLLDLLADDRTGSVVTDNRQDPRTARQHAADDRRADFLSVVLAETEDAWQEIFQANGAQYTTPTLVLYDGRTETDCGLGQAAIGPFYCPVDQRVYIDMSFFDTLDQRYGAPGDFAHAYVLAHEVGHHVQNLRGILEDYHSKRGQLSQRRANALSVRVELQADCYAGIWAHNADQSGIVEDGDIDEALAAAAAVGDDTIQRRTQGYEAPESFNHGTAEQRSHWFRIGYQSGDPADCNTFTQQPL